MNAYRFDTDARKNLVVVIVEVDFVVVFVGIDTVVDRIHLRFLLCSTRRRHIQLAGFVVGSSDYKPYYYYYMCSKLLNELCKNYMLSVRVKHVCD